ncbi:AAA-like domain-containing protein [Haliscomenobacter hydrossis]|nr:AAA-like domain-containing protein [Haliscomenobacter hydrossis]
MRRPSTNMQKEFNITGLCRPAKHYMADVSGKLAQVYKLVEKGAYFVINRPRQYGKTTMLYSLAAFLQKKEDYIVFNTSFEGIGDSIFENEKNFSAGFVKLLTKHASVSAPFLMDWLNQNKAEIDNLEALSSLITSIAIQAEKKMVLLIDEVDKSSNNQLFISFLAMLRNKYLESDNFPTFHSVILAGVHDVKSLKLKLRPDDEQKYNSPWNIATEFTVDMNLQVAEMIPMLEEYARDKQVTLDATAVAERLFYYTSGYPFLVSKLCKTIDEQILPAKTAANWTPGDVELAASMIVKENNTNFDSLIKNLENNPDLYNLVHKKLVDIEYQSYSIHDPTVSQGLMYGILKNGLGISIHNRIYEEVIYAYMTSKATSQVLLGAYNVPQNFRLPDQRLNMEAVLLKFQAFMKEQHSKKDADFLERNGRLVFLAFIKPIINGSGYDFKEPQISEERRLDVVITYFQHRYITELKIWRGAKVHAEGLAQLADYLERQGLAEGYLLVFDQGKKKSWKSGWEVVQGKRVFGVWV